MRKRTFLLAVVGLSLVSATLLVGTSMASSSTTLELEAADDTDTDSSTVSFTFTTDANASNANVQDTYSSSGGVTFEFSKWEEVGGFSSGTSTSFNADGETTYRLTYSVEADSSADERTYSYSPSVTISYDDKGSETASGSLSATVDILEPEFGTISDQDVDATFEPDDGSTLQRAIRVDIPNVGDGFMDVDDMSISGVPSYMSASVDTLPDEIDDRSTGTGRINVQVDDSISEGTHSFSVTVTDSLGNSESFTATVEVVKPPAAGASENTVDLGEILVGEDGTGEFTLTERNGFKDIAGLDTSTVVDDSQGSISFPGLGDRSISSGGSATQTVEVSVNDDAAQGEQLEWKVYFSPDDSEGIQTDQAVTFTAEVIYPPYYEELSMSGSELVFDEPRQETESFTDQVAVDIANGGDLRMELLDIAASVPGNRDIDVSVVDDPGSIGAGSTGTITLEVDASSDSVPGEWDIEVDVTANEPTSAPGEQTGTATTSATVSVEHETELRVDRTEIDAGEIIITEQTVESTTLREYLGYQPVEEFSLTQVSGPEEGWLTITEQPESLAAGQEQDFTVNIQFDTSAELYQTYTWEFEAAGANVETSTITIEAVPEPVDFGQTITELEDIGTEVDGEAEFVALEMAGTLDELEQMLKEGDGEADRNDITVLITAGSSSLLLLDAVQEAESLMDQSDHEAAQEHLVRASSAFNTFSVATEGVTSPTLQSRTEEIRGSAGTLLSDLIERQENHFLEQLEASDTTMLEEAQTKREIARLAELSGDQQRAAELREEAEEAFDSYSELISGGTEDLISARELQGELDDDLFMSPGGFRLFWISSLSTYSSESDAVLDHYDSAIEQFESAGATERAELAAAERADIESSYENAYLLSIGVGAFAAIALLVFIVWEIRALYRYRVDAEDAVSGDFLLPWAGTE